MVLVLLDIQGNAIAIPYSLTLTPLIDVMDFKGIGLADK
jgi:hypothetical protein